MRQRDHDRAVKEIKKNHAAKVQEQNHSNEVLSTAMQYRSCVIQAYEEAMHGIVEDCEPESWKIRHALAMTLAKVERAKRAYGNGASIEAVEEILAARPNPSSEQEQPDAKPKRKNRHSENPELGDKTH